MKDPALDAPVPVYPDGLLRLSSPALQTLQLTHLISGIYDEPTLPVLQTCGRPTTITGYTEWIDAAGSPATLGWDWEIRCMPGQVRWLRLSLPFTNVLLINENQRDFPWQRNLQRLAEWVDTLAWKEPLRTALLLRYARHSGH
ncbi:hypothetical protein H4CHR_05549 [Variovorax sp. PBS-H4]|uniref:DUF4902 domain-containing protein n=1 Tax=Variovorax sp. PBS-H4 TaxID=434008 RepID=UPI0013164BDC|nr:DUF4902 domain-containing protein [Variovorax sp. PBS-H4]VTU40816.1 hypothetical protein H4CHR_05549 [Variovorax sp. PBS-H4]